MDGCGVAVHPNAPSETTPVFKEQKLDIDEDHAPISSGTLPDVALANSGGSSKHSKEDFERTLLASLSASTVHAGRVHRHETRGVDSLGAREERRLEDERCRAGMRNPAASTRDLQLRWFKLRKTCTAIEAWMGRHPETHDLTKCLGKDPERPPPAEEVVRDLRQAVAKS